jgi:hypothetical protein
MAKRYREGDQPVNGPAKTLVLKEPFEFSDRIVSELKFRNKIKMKHLKGIKFHEVEVDKDGKKVKEMVPVDITDYGIKLLSAITGEFSEVIEELEPDDFASAMEIAADFLSKSPATGAKS